MRFLHTADWQLGMTRHFLEGEAQPRYAAARRDAVAALAGVAAETQAEFVVVAGDPGVLRGEGGPMTALIDGPADLAAVPAGPARRDPVLAACECSARSIGWGAPTAAFPGYPA